MISPKKIQASAANVIRIEVQAIQALLDHIDDQFIQACELFLNCSGKVIVIGMGKSGHIGNKIAATLASTGTPAFFVHPAEASHGDMGMITSKDIILAISNSGETNEILTILPVIKHLSIPLITLTGNPVSTLARNATININVSVPQEACPLGLAPTSSSTATLVMGDAIAISLLEARGFTADDFARVHPGGSLGKRLILKIQDLMRTGPQLPTICETASVREALVEMTQKNLGMTTVLNDKSELVGIYTDGDLRRTLNKDLDIHHTPIKMVMTENYKKINPNLLAIEALQMMENHKITSLLVVDTYSRLEGIILLRDLINAGL